MTELRVYGWGAMSEIPSQVYVGLLVAFCVGAWLLVWRKGLREGLRYSALLLLVEWVVVILGMAVLFREARAERGVKLIPLWSYFDYPENSYLMEVTAINILNVVMFVPVGLLLGFFNENENSLSPDPSPEGKGRKGEGRWWRVLAIGAILSVSIELLQLIFKRGLCETDDVIHNVVGCMIGYGIVTVGRQIAKKCKTE